GVEVRGEAFAVGVGGVLGTDLGEAIVEDPVEAGGGLVVERGSTGGDHEVGAGHGAAVGGAHGHGGEFRESALEVGDVDVFVGAHVVDGGPGELGVRAAGRVAEHVGCPRERVVGEQLDDEDLDHRPHQEL